MSCIKQSHHHVSFKDHYFTVLALHYPKPNCNPTYRTHVGSYIRHICNIEKPHNRHWSIWTDTPYGQTIDKMCLIETTTWERDRLLHRYKELLLVRLTLLGFIQSYNPLFLIDLSHFKHSELGSIVPPCSYDCQSKSMLFQSRMRSFSEANNCVLWVVVTKRGEVAALNCWV